MKLPHERTVLALALAALAAGSCSDTPPTVTVTPPADPAPPACADPSQAPLKSELGGYVCTPVGASDAAVEGEFGDLATLGSQPPAPVRYVRAGASPGGDGSPTRPFATVTEALAGGANGTLVLSRGMHALEASARFDGAFAVLGAGAGVTTVRVAFGRTAFGASGASARGLVQALAVDSVETSSPGTEGALEALDGAALRLRDVRVVGARVGVRASGTDSTLDADRLTVLRAASVGVAVLDGARGLVHHALVRDGQNYGTFAGASAGREAEPVGGRLHLFDSLIAAHGGYGVVYTGAARPGAGASGCAVAGPLTAPGDRDCLARVAVQGNTAAGLTLVGNRDVDARRLVVTGTRASADGLWGDGVYVSAGARLALDVDLTGDENLGEGSRVIGNARAGVLVDGAGAHLAVHAALVGTNRGPGVFVQRGAAGDEVHYSGLVGNGGVGLGVTPTSTLTSILCDMFLSTHQATFTTPAGERYVLADGLSAYGLTGATITGNALSHNERFGVVLLDSGGEGAAAVVLRGNTGMNNQYGVGNYNARGVTIDDPGAIAGRLSPPTAPPRVADAQSVR